jgi:DNA modification methylase
MHEEIADVLAGRRRWCVICADCLDVLPTLPDGCVDAVIVDPPYGLDYEYKSYDDTPENLAILAPSFVQHARRAASRVIVFPGVHNLWVYPRADWVLSWSWRTTAHFGKCGYSMWQPVLFYGKDLDGFGSVNGTLKADSIHFPDGRGIGFLGDGHTDHPCPKPERVMLWAVKRFSVPDGVVADVCAGSGTTGVAAIQMGRRFIGIEIDEGYADIARRRIAEADTHLFNPH